jgi:hypothetical protein
VREETARLLTELESRQLAVGAIVWNRATSPAPLPTGAGIPQLFAPPFEGLAGIDRIREWAKTWTT